MRVQQQRPATLESPAVSTVPSEWTTEHSVGLNPTGPSLFQSSPTATIPSIRVQARVARSLVLLGRDRRRGGFGAGAPSPAPRTPVARPLGRAFVKRKLATRL